MKGLKIVLWICAIAFLLSFVALLIPWRFMAQWMSGLGIDVLSSAPVKAYAVRVMLAGSGLIGIFFAILATDPLRYGPMVPLAGWGLVFIGLICLAAGLRYGLPAIMFAFDAAFSIVFGTLVLLLRAKAVGER